MEEYNNVRAPQWMDFTKSPSPQVSTPDFFEKVHVMHERMQEDACDSTYENAENADPQHSLANEKAYSTKIQEENIIKSTPIKVISPTSRGKKVEHFTTYDEVLGDAIRNLEFYKGLSRMQDGMNKSAQKSTDFKTPITAKLVKSSRSVGYRSLPHKSVQAAQDSKSGSAKIGARDLCARSNYAAAAKPKKTSVSLSLFKEDRTKNATVTEEPCDSVDNVKHNEEERENKEIEETRDAKDNEEEDKKCDVNVTEESNEERDAKKDGEGPNERDDSKPRDESEESASDKQDGKEEGQDVLRHTAAAKGAQSLPKVLTWQNHRRTTFGNRRLSVSKKYVSMAEAVSRFHSETPKRFRTRSTKDSASLNATKLAQCHLKPTIPISPALVSKNRTRPVKVLSREEKEMLELEEMKKHRIKANPVPRNVLRGPRAPRKNNATQPAEKSAKSLPSLHSEKTPHGAKSDAANMVTTVVVTDADGIVVKREEISNLGVPSMMKSVTRVEPFSFETRRKDLQKGKEERPKSTQETARARSEFHARPAPSFSKPPTPVAKQQKPARRQVVPRPFSFDERDKQIPKKKEQLVKQMLEEEKRSRLFRANPVPVFKPVPQHAGSKDRIPVKDKTARAESSREDQKEPETARSASYTDKQKTPLTKRVHSFELNTDKRARERREFDERMRRKEMEEEAMRQEREQKRERQMRMEMRKLTEVKARPMPAFKLPVIVKQVKPLTDPQSPAFMSKLRSKQQ